MTEFEELLLSCVKPNLAEGYEWKLKMNSRALTGWEVEVENENGYSEKLIVTFEEILLFIANL